jgi:formylglycine-generating enzyme required for sulfatase activity
MSRQEDEARHEVTISKPFYVGVYEVTQRQYYKLMMPDYDFDAWKYKRGPIADGAAYCFRYPTEAGLIFGASATGGPQTDLNPMECVTWEEAREFCAKVTEVERKAGRLPEGYVYRLPTEAEWEYACRAGTQGPYNVDGNYTEIVSLRKFAWVAGAGSSPGTRPVGKNREPNAWGLYDMHGNVYEWCLDWYGPYPEGKVTDPVGPAEGKEKVIRGGGFSGYKKDEDMDVRVHPFLRSAARYSVPPDLGYLAFVGFRVVLAPEAGRGGSDQ